MRHCPSGFSDMTQPGEVFAVDCLRLIVPSKQKVDQLNEEHHSADPSTPVCRLDASSRTAFQAFPENTIQVALTRWYDDGMGDQALPFGTVFTIKYRGIQHQSARKLALLYNVKSTIYKSTMSNPENFQNNLQESRRNLGWKRS
ncbi:uncharacterized protein [Dermacentor albipictus]|uniref:uncharacterized protein isoform X2 n=1 Tax=Dermacentor albipictus TaxID=60249 RepID=UPI0031FCE66F